jgi:hypothetical protein
MKTLASFLILIALLPNVAQAALDGIDTFGSRQVTIEQILVAAKSDIENFVAAITSRDEKAMEQSYTAAKTKIEKLGHFAFVKISLIQYPPPKPSIYVTVDLVDQADQAKRMNFLPSPHKSFLDPGHLLAAWEAYQDLGLKLMLSGDLKVSEKCPAFHCVVGFDDPRLKQYGAQFNDQVPKYESTLYEILREDQDPRHRANAVFLLAHTHDGKKLVRNLTPSIRDEAEEVRNNVMRVFGYVGQFHPELTLPTEAIAEALNFPTTTDRNKALFALASISQITNQREYLIKNTGSLLVSILKLQQPNNHDLAYSVLKTLSGRNFGEHDYSAWEKWLADQNPVNRK